MSHHVAFNSVDGLIESEVFGELTQAEAKELISEIGELAKQHVCYLCLTDYREAKLLLTTLELYEIPRLLADILVGIGLSDYQFKRAIIVKSSEEDFHFLETVSMNSGQNVRLFTDKEEGRKWLLESQG